VREPGGRAPIMRTVERYVTKGFGKPQARSKIGLSQYVYMARVPSGHNTLRRNLYIMGLLDSPSYKGLGRRSRPQLTFCVSEVLAILGHTYLGSFFLDPEDVRSSRLRKIWNFINP